MKASLRAPAVRRLSPAEIRRRARRIRLFAMDVDGVLTNGDILIYDSGEEVKVWNVKDRIGFFMLRKLGERFPVAWITGRRSLQVESRAKEIGAAALYQHCDNKGAALAETQERLGIAPAETLFIGDDLVDLAAFRRAALAVCPSDAHPAARRACHWVTRAPGGRGAVREVIDAVLEAQGLMQGLLAGFENPVRRPNP